MKATRIVNVSLMLLISSVYGAVDPTRPPGQQNYTQNSNVSSTKIELQGIVIGVKSWVVINDLVLMRGQSKKGINVLKIEDNRVLVKVNGDKFWLKWQSELIKKNYNAE